jgi:hypothetical protein
LHGISCSFEGVRTDWANASRITAPEIARRLNIWLLSIYAMPEKEIIPGMLDRPEVAGNSPGI